jgi:hypothetical protein
MQKLPLQKNERLKEFISRILAIILGIIVSVFALEILLRFFPVYGGTHYMPVNQREPIMRFEPNRTFVWSKGWNFAIVNKIKTNNFGFINALDYDQKATSPLLAVIGDSYVEALMVPFNETIAGRLAQRFMNAGRVYTFGVSGAPLSQYLAYAEYVQDTFRPDGMIIVVIGNDFDESLMKYMPMPGFHFFVETSAGELVLERADFSVSFTKKMLRKSALLRYLLANLQVEALPKRFKALVSKGDEYALFAGNSSADADSTRVADSKRVIEAFFDELPVRSGLRSSQILFVIDGIRPHLYDEKKLALARGRYFDVMRRYFISSAKAGGYEIVDMQPVFIDHYQKYSNRFEYSTDLHWNALGHRVVFEAITQSTLLARFTNKSFASQ